MKIVLPHEPNYRCGQQNTILLRVDIAQKSMLSEEFINYATAEGVAPEGNLLILTLIGEQFIPFSIVKPSHHKNRWGDAYRSEIGKVVNICIEGPDKCKTKSSLVQEELLLHVPSGSESSANTGQEHTGRSPSGPSPTDGSESNSQTN